MALAPWEQSLFDEIDGDFAQIVNLRHQLHQHPELSGEERETSLMLYQQLGDMGFQVRMGIDGRGVVSDFLWQRPTQVCLRADIDALQIQDKKDVQYRSQCDGVMHACGHDAHSAMVYGALSAIQRVIAIHKLQPIHGIRAIFQPAEETCQGAMDMIEVGALDSVVRIFGVHVDPTRSVGTIGVRSGVLTASCDEILFDVHGAGGHAARPHEAVDPIVAAAHLIQVLYKFIPRATDSQDAVVLTIGMIKGGHNSNVIPDNVKLGGTLRTLNEEVREKTLQHIQRLADGVSHISGASIRYRTGMSVPSVSNEDVSTDQLAASAAMLLQQDCITQIPRPSMGSEDFAFYLEHVPGAMFRLGCASERVGSSALHTPTFDVDDEALRVGAKILAHAALSSMVE
jgi:amidohydrolase